MRMKKKKKYLEKRQAKEEDVLYSTLFGSVTPREDTWIIGRGSFKHVTGKKTNLSGLEENNSPQKVSLGDDYQYLIKGIGESRYKLDSGTSMKMKEVLYVPGLKKKLLSILTLDKKGYTVVFYAVQRKDT